MQRLAVRTRHFATLELNLYAGEVVVRCCKKRADFITSFGGK